jgi:crossover junction endodeoxyribonuclease RuvC
VTAGVIGIDLSLRRTAVADIDGEVRVIPADAVPDEDHQGAMVRLDQVTYAVTNRLWAIRNQIELVMIEGYSFGSSSKGTRAIAELGGAVRLRLWRHRIPYLDVPPKTVKKYATGNGNAGKNEMVRAANKRLGYDGFDDNEADALWLRAIGCELLSMPVCPMPINHRMALDALRRTRPVCAPTSEVLP